jgi:hypothetical protein
MAERDMTVLPDYVTASLRITRRASAIDERIGVLENGTEFDEPRGVEKVWAKPSRPLPRSKGDRSNVGDGQGVRLKQ